MGDVLSSSSSTTTKKKKAPVGTVSDVDRAMLDLKNARDRLSRYKKKLEQDESRIVDRAKKAKQEGQTKNALNLLRLRKMKQREVESVESQLLNVMQMVQTIDSKQNEAQVLAAMAKGKDSLQKMHEETSVEDVLDLMDAVSEQNEVEREISSILQGAPSTLSVEDEAAVEAELEAMMMDMQGQTVDLPEVPATTPLPTAPTNKLPVTATAEKDEGRVAVAS
jgi:charged multivesicular body protein 6